MSDLDTINQRTVSAASAPPAGANAAMSSPFAMGKLYLGDSAPDAPGQGQIQAGADAPAPAPDAKPARRTRGPGKAKGPAQRNQRDGTLIARAMKTLQACGPLTAEMFAQALDLPLPQTRKLISNGQRYGYWHRVALQDGSKVVELSAPPPSDDKSGQEQRGFKGFLTRKGQAAAVRPSKRAQALPAPSTQPARKNRPQAPQQPSVGPSVSCGLFNDGTLLITTDDASIELTRRQARDVVAYLELIASALQE